MLYCFMAFKYCVMFVVDIIIAIIIVHMYICSVIIIVAYSWSDNYINNKRSKDHTPRAPEAF